MSIFKCKMCDGELQINPGESVAVCDYCATTQTLPKLDDDRRANLYDRANHFRRNNDFDKAAGIYEQILNEDKTDAEAYWSLVLCRYGIEYVEDPATHKRVPTVNRAQYTSIFDDEDYKAAIQYADAAQRVVYETEAKAINEIQKGILEISQKEEPFDVFICYKETDANGRRTPDSVLATDLYHQLTQEGFKVFFSRITLEDKLGIAYEPYIFAALNSAKVMVVLGTKPEYFNAVWVKNEWSRYLALIRGGAKKVMIPAYRDMDPHDLPEEFSHLQAQDMSKLGFMQDLIRGIKKLTETDRPAAKETVVVQESAANTAPLLKRAFIFLEDGDWSSADEYCEKVLDLDPENAQAYLGKLLAELRVRKQEQLADCDEPFDNRDNFRKVIRFGDKALCAMRSFRPSCWKMAAALRWGMIPPRPRPMSHGLTMMTKTASGSMNGGITAATAPLWNRTLRRGYRNTSAFTTSVSSRPRLPAFTSITLPSAPWTLGHFPSRPATPRMRSSTTISASRLKMDHFWRGGI